MKIISTLLMVATVAVISLNAERPYHHTDFREERHKHTAVGDRWRARTGRERMDGQPRRVYGQPRNRKTVKTKKHSTKVNRNFLTNEPTGVETRTEEVTERSL